MEIKITSFATAIQVRMIIIYIAKLTANILDKVADQGNTSSFEGYLATYI